jgi:hypothetical protein
MTNTAALGGCGMPGGLNVTTGIGTAPCQCRRNFAVVNSDRWNPNYGAMAGCAVGSASQVVSNFTRGLYTVVTSHALCAGGAVIHFCADRKSALGMANVALQYGGNMVNKFTARRFAVMAARTLLRQTFEYTINMTGLAT